MPERTVSGRRAGARPAPYRLARARVKGEACFGTRLPEPEHIEGQPIDIETIGLAFAVLLESLSPLERAAFMLHEVFGYSHAEVAAILQSEERACRQSNYR